MKRFVILTVALLAALAWLPFPAHGCDAVAVVQAVQAPVSAYSACQVQAVVAAPVVQYQVAYPVVQQVVAYPVVQPVVQQVVRQRIVQRQVVQRVKVQNVVQRQRIVQRIKVH